ncbi:MAG TPA: saccharopine dehydrogenase NADP-binding domain-containing protein [Bryobacteraceae bacterium]|nr:saccharopine dehydrogenase NADP-binding domain-containing protein [Bryobacteraceae bacterium]
MLPGRTVNFGIVGGYGATGRVVASQLRKSCDGEVLVGGRDLAKGKAFAAEFDSRVSAASVDILDARSLDGFCSRCSIIVNCAGPVMVLQDRVAQAAFRSRCHYIDAAGMSFVKERMLAHSREIEDLGLSFVISAGWMPGLSELLPVYAGAQATATMDAIESLTVYFGDSGEWSVNALRDAAWFIHQSGLRGAGYFRKGEWTRAKMSEAFRRVDLGDPVGGGRFAMYWTPELREVGRRLKTYDVYTYTYLSGFRTVMASTLMALLPVPEGLGVRLLRNVFRRNRLPVGGFVAAQVLGRSRGNRLSLTAQIVFRGHRDYWIHGLALATAARMVSESQGVRPGVNFLADAVDPIAFLAELRKAGIEQTENFEAMELMKKQ